MQLGQAGSGLGDVAYFHDPGSGFSGNDRIWFRGRRLAPAAHRIHETEWDPVEGQGFYYMPSGIATTEAWIDMTATVATTPAASSRTFLRTMEVSITGGVF